MKRLHLSGTAVAAMTAALLTTSCGISLQSLPKLGGISGPTYTLRATFSNVVNLPANAEVRVGAFSVGYVSSIGLQDFQAVVTMKIKKQTHLPAGTTAAIRFDTPLGEDFVLLQPPNNSTSGGPQLPSGASIPESETTTAPSVEDAFGALGALLNGGGINQLQTIIDQTNLALGGNQQKIRDLINYLDQTVTSLASNTPAVDQALQAMASLTQVLNQGSTVISQGINTIGPAAQVLSNETGDLDQLLLQLDRLSTAANTIVTASATGTVQTLRALQPLLIQLTNVQGELGPALSAIAGVEQYTPRAVPGNYLQLSIAANVQIPPVPSDALPLQRITVDPPDQDQAYQQSGIAQILEDGLP